MAHGFHTDLFWPLPVTIVHASLVAVTLVATVLNVPQNGSAFGYLAQGLAYGFVLKYCLEGC